MHLSTSTSASCVCCHLCGQHGWLFSWHSSLFWLHTLYSMSLFAVMHMLDLVHLFVVLYDKTGCFVANLSWFVFRHFEHTVAVLTANHWIELADVLGGCAVPFLRMMIGCWSKPCRNPQRLCWSICIWKKNDTTVHESMRELWSDFQHQNQPKSGGTLDVDFKNLTGQLHQVALQHTPFWFFESFGT